MTMIDRAQNILDSVAGFPVDVAQANRVAAAFIPPETDPATLTNEEKAAIFVRGMRRLIKLHVLRAEERAAAEAALLAARADVEANVEIGDD